MKHYEIFKINGFVVVEFEILNQLDKAREIPPRKFQTIVHYHKQSFDTDEEFFAFLSNHVHGLAPDLELDPYSSIYEKSIKICQNTNDINKAIDFEIKLHTSKQTEMEIELQNMMNYQWFVSGDKVLFPNP